MAGYSLKIFKYDPIAGSIIQSSGTITVDIADNPTAAIYDSTSGALVPVYVNGSEQEGYTVVKTSVSAETYGEQTSRYVISKDDGWTGNPTYLTFKPNLSTASSNIYSTPSDLVVKNAGSGSFALAYLNVSQAPTAFAWYKRAAGESEFEIMSDISGSVSGSRTRVLSLQNISMSSDNGSEYECKSTMAGTGAVMTSSISKLYVCNPVVVSNTEPGHYSPGVDFELSIDGIENISSLVTGYQWYENNVALTEATSSTLTKSVSSSGTYVYKCEITTFGNQKTETTSLSIVV